MVGAHKSSLSNKNAIEIYLLICVTLPIQPLIVGITSWSKTSKYNRVEFFKIQNTIADNIQFWNVTD